MHLCFYVIFPSLFVFQINEDYWMQYVVVCDTSGWYLEFVDPIFLGIYIVELVIKFYALRLYFFRDPWNWFG